MRHMKTKTKNKNETTQQQKLKATSKHRCQIETCPITEQSNNKNIIISLNGSRSVTIAKLSAANRSIWKWMMPLKVSAVSDPNTNHPDNNTSHKDLDTLKHKTDPFCTDEEDNNDYRWGSKFKPHNQTQENHMQIIIQTPNKALYPTFHPDTNNMFEQLNTLQADLFLSPRIQPQLDLLKSVKTFHLTCKRTFPTSIHWLLLKDGQTTRTTK